MDASKRTYQDDSGPYVLPNDSEEHVRLDRQYHAFLKLMGKTFHAPVLHPKRILDVGCGTGIMTAELARMFPDAQVIGVDIAPVPVHRHGVLPNVRYIQGDISTLASTNNSDLGSSFDYVFSRLMMFAITDWPRHVKTLVGLLAPGGFIELQDVNFEIRAGPHRSDFIQGANMTATWDWHKQFVEDCAAGGLDMFCGKHLVEWEKSAGAKDVREEVYLIPPGGPRDAQESDPGFWDKTVQMQGALIEKVCSRHRSAETVRKLKEEMSMAIGGLKEGDCSTMHVAVGQAQ